MTVTSRAAINSGNQNPAEQIDMRIAPMLANVVFGGSPNELAVKAQTNTIYGGATQAVSTLNLARNTILVGPFTED